MELSESVLVTCWNCQFKIPVGIVSFSYLLELPIIASIFARLVACWRGREGEGDEGKGAKREMESNNRILFYASEIKESSMENLHGRKR